MKYNNLEDKVIIVTGGSGLIGSSILKHVELLGGTCYSFDKVKSPIGRHIECDITSSDSIRNAINRVFSIEKRIDGFVNNAYPRTSDWGADFLSMTEDSLEKNISWQLNSYIICCQEIIKYMLEQQSGSIINVASIYGIVGNDFTIYEGSSLNPPAPYSAIKGGLINFTRFLASKYGKNNIRVNAVSPGGIFDNQPSSFVQAYEKKVPMKRMGKPEDIAPAISFLLSDDAGYITGHNLVVDGGWTAI